MATVKFLLRNKKTSKEVTINYCINLSAKKRLRGTTALKIIPEYFDQKKEKVRNKTEVYKTKDNINTRLYEFKAFVFEKLSEYKNKDIDRIATLLKNDIEIFLGKKKIEVNEKSELVTYAIQKIIDEAPFRDNGKGGVGLGQCRINAYKRLKALFIDFQNRNQYKIVQLDKNVFDNFKKWLLDKNNYSPTYAFKKLSDLKTVCKDARSNGIETSSELNDIKTKQISAYDDDMDVIILTPEELKKIENTELTSEALINARKWLILGCYTGQRGAALTTRIKKENFEKFGSDLVIKIRQKKGNKSVIIPVLPKVKEIYENGMPYAISLIKLNKYFKDIGELAKLNNPVMGRIIEAETKGKKRGIKKLRPKYKYISTHIGRRTFASNHYGKIPTPIIMKVTGHSKESTFLTYINQTDDSHISTFLDYYKTEENKAQKKAAD